MDRRAGRGRRAPVLRRRRAVATYFAAATRAAQVLAALRAPYRGRSTQVNACWGSFDLAVILLLISVGPIVVFVWNSFKQVET